MMLGEVPTSVISPPRRDANAIGIRKTDGLVSFFLAIWKAAGISMASAPTFLTSADATPTELVSSSNWERTRVTRRDTKLSATSIAPERCTAADMTSAEATMITMSSEKPLNASSGLTSPIATAASSAMIAVMS